MAILRRACSVENIQLMRGTICVSLGFPSSDLGAEVIVAFDAAIEALAAQGAVRLIRRAKVAVAL